MRVQYLSMFLCVTLATVGVCLAGDPVRVDSIPVAQPPENAIVLPWVAPDDPSWNQGKPAFHVEDKSSGMSGEGWLAATSDALLIRLVAKDREHLPPAVSTLYAGDAVELCIDARGDGTRGLGRNKAGLHGPDDAKFMMAIMESGPYIRRVAGGRGKQRQELPGALKGVHDAERGETVYELRLDWDLFDTRPGLYDTLGIAIQFNDLDAGMKDKRVLKWGDGTFGKFRPGLFNRVWVSPPTGEYTAVAVDNAVLWDPKDAADAIVAVASKETTKLTVRLGKIDKTVDLPAAQGLRRYRVTLMPADCGEPSVPVSVSVRQEGKDKPLADVSGTIEFPQPMYEALIDELSQAIASAENPLMLRHLKSVRSLVMCEWARMQLIRATAPMDAERTRECVKIILDGFRDGDAGQWETYLKGRRNLIFAYSSPHDRSMQYYQFSLPSNWDPTKTYPLFFELHGSTDPNPLAIPSWQLGPIPEGADRTKQSFAAIQSNGYWCEPFGRGNLRYRGIAEVDVWEAYDDVHRRFKIDPDRRYLYGFSMGGGGTWSLATRTPDRWAAAAVLAGGMWSDKAGVGQARNMAHLPVMLWCGERDGLFSNLARMEKELKRFGGKPLVKSTPDLAHNYRMDVQEDVITWLQKHTRQRPDRFQFVADTDEHRGAYGVMMVRDLTVSGVPSFTCTVKGNDVTIDSEGTPGLKVVAGEGGLGLDGEITITWNGERVYKGPTKTVTLGK